MTEQATESWKWERVDDTGSVTVWTLKGPDVLCRFWHDKPPSADGRKIAAASELLAACKSPGTKETFGIPGDDKTWPELLRTLVDGLDTLPPDAAPHSWYLWRALLRHKADEIEAAIARAKPEGK